MFLLDTRGIVVTRPDCIIESECSIRRWRLVSAPNFSGVFSMDPMSDASALLASLTSGTEVEIQFGRSLQVLSPFPWARKVPSKGFGCLDLQSACLMLMLKISFYLFYANLVDSSLERASMPLSSPKLGSSKSIGPNNFQLLTILRTPPAQKQITSQAARCYGSVSVGLTTQMTQCSSSAFCTCLHDAIPLTLSPSASSPRNVTRAHSNVD